MGLEEITVGINTVVSVLVVLTTSLGCLWCGCTVVQYLL